MGVIAIVFLAVFTDAVVRHREFMAAAKPYRTMIRDAAKRFDVNPHVVAAVLWKESRFNPAAVGSAGEIGMGQMRPIALEDLKLKPSDIEGRPADQIFATANLLALNRGRAGDMLTAIRAYNVGIGAAKESVDRGMGYAADVCRLAAVDMVYRVIDSYV